MISNIKTKFISISKKIINNKLITNNKLEVDYNRNNLNINKYSNGQVFYTKLNNNDLINIFTSKSPKLELKNRLFNEYYKNKKNAYKIKKSLYKNKKHIKKLIQTLIFYKIYDI